MHFKNSVLLVFILMLLQCKSADTSQSVKDTQQTPVIILLENNLSPTDIETVKMVSVESMKRTSRSQNQWMIKVVEKRDKVDELIKKLRKDSRVIEVSIASENQDTNELKNVKSGKSGPIKN